MSPVEFLENHISIEPELGGNPDWIQSYFNQAKQMELKYYSEQELLEMIYNIIGEYTYNNNIIINGDELNQLVEKHKKK
jgi:uncharacterized protein (DUF2164 family)